MDRAMVDQMRDVENRHWWFVTRREILVGVLERSMPTEPRTLLDVGCGTGANLEAIAARFPELVATGLDTDPVCRESCAHRGLNVCAASAEGLPVGDASHDVVTALDVLEHVDDEHATAREMLRVLRPGGTLVLTVPAYQWMWSRHDELLHHRRRYTRTRVVKVLRDAGFEVVYSTYFNTVLFPLAVASRLGSRLSGRYANDQALPAGPVNAALRALFATERPAIRRSIRLPYGLSVLAVARKPEA